MKKFLQAWSNMLRPRKKTLATLAALLCMMALMPMTAKAQGNVINTVVYNEVLTKSSTVYVGEVVVDGVSEIKYLYSGDITLSSSLLQNLLDGLNGMADGDYVPLLAAYESYGYIVLPEQRLALCSNPDLIAAMDENWSSAGYVGTLYYADKSVVSDINSNLYDLDAGFKAVLDAKNAERMEPFDNPIDAPKGFVTHLGSTAIDNVYYTVENNIVIKHVEAVINYNSEVTTVIYTKVELETLMTETPLTFEAVEAGTITVNLDEGATLEAIQYKLNDAEWTAVTWNEAISLAANDVISFRGDNGTCYINDDDLEIWAGFHFECSNPCYVYGNMMSLIDEDDFATNTTLTEPFTFFHLFQTSDYEPNNTILNHPTKDIVLPATTLTPYCYDGLFADAPNITRAPELPATTLAEWCYSEMFSGTAITTAPALPASTLADACYSDMFMNCTNLTTAPELPATVLAEGCYSSMFAGCTSLNYVKCLATDISADFCTTSWMWNVAPTGTFVKAAGIEDWTTGEDGIPEGWTVKDDMYSLPLTFESLSNTLMINLYTTMSLYGLQYRTYNASNNTWSNWSTFSSGSTNNPCYVTGVGSKIQFKRENNAPLAIGYDAYSYFKNITGNCYVYGNVMSLYNFETVLNDNYACYGLFDGNTGIRNHPTKDLVLGATTLSNCCYMRMFRNCTGLTRIPELPATTLAKNCYYEMFKGCTALNTTPVLPATTLAESCYYGMFRECTSLTTPPVLPATTLAVGCYWSMFYGCTNLQTAPALPATIMMESCYSGMFGGCTSLQTAPELPATTLSVACYHGMFEGCTGLTVAPALPATVMVDKCYKDMFSNCTNLQTAPALPSTSMAYWCYYKMFEGCTSLTTAPVLPATTLAEGCYIWMFWSCSNLNYVKCLATDISADNCTLNWLTNVSPTGTFVKAAGMEDWEIGVNPDDGEYYGIPEGWNVENIDVFTTDGNWNVAANWSGNVVPADGSDVAIVANATIPSGTTVNADNINLYGTLTIADGGQLYHNNDGVTATIKKNITAYGTETGVNNGWHLIGHSFADNGAIDEMDNLTANDYDLYYYDEPTHYWMNQKNAENNFTELEAARGYLYANSQALAIGLKGTLNTANATVNVPLNYTDGIDLAGFNLVGNPFAHNVTTYTGTNVAEGCYVMNETKDDLTVSEISAANPLKPGDGFFVKATAENASITFNSGAKGETAKTGRINLELRENGKLIDRLIVKQAGEPLEKLTLRENSTKLYATEDAQDYAVVVAEGNEQAVNFKPEKDGTYTLNVNVENMDLDYLHLIDNLTGADIDLLHPEAVIAGKDPQSHTPMYTFTAKTTDYANRFRLVFSASGDADGDNVDAPFAYISNGNIVITADARGASLQVIDMMGRVVCSTDVARNVSTYGMAKGVYVLRLINGSDVKTQKIVMR